MNASKPVTGRTRTIIICLDRGILWLSKHWLALCNLSVGGYAGLPFLAPLFARLNFLAPARAIYFLYSYFCHQRPERSFFLFGHQMAYCERDTALYTTLFFFGLIFGLTRSYWQPLPIWGFGLSVLPMFVDGSLQFVGGYESTPVLRVATGVLASVGSAWFIYPRFDQSFKRVGQLAAEQLRRAALRDHHARV